MNQRYSKLLSNIRLKTPSCSLLVDLGHWNLFYYRGMYEYFTNTTQRGRTRTYQCKKMLWVRIRRSRYEAAVSLTYLTEGAEVRDICASMAVGFCPYQNEQAVLLHPPKRHVWDQLDHFQQALWLIDETEARWQAFKRDHLDMHFIELPTWSSHSNATTAYSSSLQCMFDKMTDVIGVPRRSLEQLYEGGHSHVHAGLKNSALEHAAAQQRFEHLDRDYKEAMQYKCTKPGPGPEVLTECGTDVVDTSGGVDTDVEVVNLTVAAEAR
jgi:hypothetical protein